MWDSTSEMRYVVLPQRPSGTEGWSEEKLRDLVTRNSMIGVEEAQRPATTEDAIERSLTILGGMQGFGPVRPEPESEEPVFHVGRGRAGCTPWSGSSTCLGLWNLDMVRRLFLGRMSAPRGLPRLCSTIIAPSEHVECG